MSATFKSDKTTLPGWDGEELKTNEDYVIADDNKGIYVIADGIGGHPGGDFMSQLAANLTAKELSELKENIGSYNQEAIEIKLKALMENINADVFVPISKHSKGLRNAGTTLDFAFVDGYSCYIGHTGDSRAYLFREGNLTQITSDQLTSTGSLKGYVGRKENQFDLLHIPLIPGDTILLATDGVEKTTSQQELELILKNQQGETRTNQIAANAYKALHNLSETPVEYIDDTTAIFIDVYGGQP